MVLIQPEWDFYFCKVEGKIASIMLDLALVNHLPIENKPFLVQVAVDLQSPDSHGLTTQSEAEVLFILEDQLSDVLGEELDALYVARNTSAGKRTFYFYTASTTAYRGILAEIMDGFTFSFTSQATSDPGWTFYKEFLFPTQQEYRSIVNRKVVDQLIAQGDNPEIPREVAHKCQFPAMHMAERFLRHAGKANFEIAQLRERSGSTQVEVVLTRKDAVYLERIDEVVQSIVKMMNPFKGVYQGWNTFIAIGE
ncbi:MAG: DUF695 domain-containing protein [Bacteroidota bacterium]